jgi:hypothetical protein
MRPRFREGEEMTDGFEEARRKVQAPAIFLLVAGVLNGLTSLSIIALAFGAITLENGKHFFNLYEREAVIGALSLPISLLICVSALFMKHLRYYALALTGSILALVPCCGGICWPVSLAAGIWALVMLTNSDVKAAFQ